MANAAIRSTPPAGIAALVDELPVTALLQVAIASLAIVRDRPTHQHGRGNRAALEAAARCIERLRRLL